MKHQNKIRVLGLCIVMRDNKEVLAGLGYDHEKKENFGRILGGGVELGERAEEAVQREFEEEISSKLENLTFLKVVENFFKFNGEQGHEIIFLYKGDLVDKSLYQKEKIKINENDDYAEWIPVSDVLSKKTILYPEFDFGSLL